MKVYFKNLDGIRFIAAFLVVIHHAFFFKLGYSPGPEALNYAFEDAGRMGVNLFFILSGFLITYLLMVEKDASGTVAIKNFYVRRILRIWPLYLTYGLFITICSPFVLAKLGLAEPLGLPAMITNIIFLLLFAVNIQLAFFTPNSGIFEISWSVCIEEQFYLVWPLIIARFRHKLVNIFIVMFAIRMTIRILCVVVPMFTEIPQETLIKINYLLIFDKLDLFGGGMLMAHLYFNRERFKSLFNNIMKPWVQYVGLVLAIMYMLSMIPVPKSIAFYLDHLFVIILFGYLVLMAIADNSVLNLEHKLIKTLGKVTYGIYLFHTAICQVTLILFKKMIGKPESRMLYDVAYPLVCIVITCIIAYFAYELFEKRFLKSKTKFAFVKTPV